ncbi:MAG: hypothetical protein RIM23_23995 [Coleofasciculus sp. G3-WIS-01]|uniref:hypothetical protein n=1 Tax=Coleofasciculus sp. G3-WIS-01 TaxID=3069528 RepID=UPI0032F82B88
MARLYITSKGEPRQQPAFRRSLFFVRTTWLGFSFTAGRNLTNQWSYSFLGCDVWSGKHITATSELACLMSIRPSGSATNIHDSISLLIVATQNEKPKPSRNIKRMKKLKAYANNKYKTVTQLIED